MDRYLACALVMLFIMFQPGFQGPAVADETDLEGLARSLTSEDDAVRFAAVEALGQVGDPEAVHLLINALSITTAASAREMAGGRGSDFKFRQTVAQTLGEMGEIAFEPLIAALDDQNRSIRNGAAMALVYLGDERAIEPLIAGLRQGPGARGPYNSGALSGLRQFGSRAVEPLIAALQGDDPSIRANAAIALSFANNSRAVPALIKALQDEDPMVRSQAALALGTIREAAAVEPLLALLEDEEPLCRSNACSALGWLGDDRALDPLLAMLGNDESPRVRTNAAQGLGRLENKQVFEPLLHSLRNDPDWMVRGAAASALAEVDKERAVEPLLEALSLKDAPPPEDAGETHQVTERLLNEDCDPVENTRVISQWERERERYLQSVVFALSNLRETRAIEPLIEMLEDENPQIRRVSARILGNLRDERAVEPLLKAVEDEDPRVSRYAVEALQRLGHPRGGEKMQSVDAPAVCSPPDDRSRRTSARALANRAGTEDEIAAMLESGDPEVRAVALLALGTQGDPADMARVAAGLEDDEELVRVCAIEALSYLRDPRIRLLAPILGNRGEETATRVAAAKALGTIGKQSPSMPLMVALQDEAAEIRTAAASGLGDLRDDGTALPLIEALKDEDEDVRTAAALSLGKLGDPRAVEPLLSYLDSSDQRTRMQALMALGQLKDERAVEPLLEVLRNETRENVFGVINALGEIGDPRAVEPLLAMLDNGWARENALMALSNIPDPRAIQVVIDSFGEEEENRWRWSRAGYRLAQLGEPALAPLISSLRNQSPLVRANAAQALGQMKDERVVDPLIKTLAEDESEQVRAKAAFSLGWTGDQRAMDPLTAALNDPSDQVRKSAVNGLGALENEQLIDVLVTALDDDSAEVRTAVLLQLMQFDDPKIIDPLLAALADSDGTVRQKAALALCYTGQDDARIGQAFQSAVDNRDLAMVSGAYAWLIEKGLPGYLPLLEEALTAHWYQEMAQDLLMCGNRRLELAVRNRAMTQNLPGVRFSNEYCVLCPRWGRRISPGQSDIP